MSTESRLGSLPLEVLQRIGIFMLRDHTNLSFHDLLKASPELCSRLNTSTIKQELVLKVLFDEPATWQQFYRTLGLDQAAFYRFVTTTTDQKWFTFAAYKTFMADYFKKEAVFKYEAWILKHGIEYEGCVREKVSQMVTNAFRNLKLSPDGMNRSYSRRIHVSKAAEHENTLKINFCPGSLWMKVEEHSRTRTVELDTETRTDHHGQLRRCSIPRKLLIGPWTKEKLDLLQLLRHRGMIIATNDRSVADRGLMDAIRSNDLRAMKTLLPPMADWHVPVPKALKPVPASPRVPKPLCHLDITPLKGHLTSAVFDMGCNPEIVERILFASRYECDLSPKTWTHAVYNWAVIDDAVGGSKGTWLLECYEARPAVLTDDEQDRNEKVYRWTGEEI
ncbi:hypothetical protein MMC18_006638 [Xylographa bjoerkii]|nr:hypothetical protein [Xylographa bjoerkii]